MKTVTFIIVLFLIILTPFTGLFAQKPDLGVDIKDVICQDKGEYIITFGLLNNRNYDRQNVHIVFKIIKENKPLACHELKLTFPANADGTEEHELVIHTETTCEKALLNCQIFQLAKRYKIDEWLSDCP